MRKTAMPSRMSSMSACPPAEAEVALAVATAVPGPPSIYTLLTVRLCSNSQTPPHVPVATAPSLSTLMTSRQRRADSPTISSRPTTPVVGSCTPSAAPRSVPPPVVRTSTTASPTVIPPVAPLALTRSPTSHRPTVARRRVPTNSMPPIAAASSVSTMCRAAERSR